MGLFGKKKDKDKVQHYSLNNKLFPVSKPWGYSPAHVEEAINGYTTVIENQKVAISKLKEEISFYKNRYDQLDTEYKNLQLQLNFVSVPSMSEIQEDYIQGKFKEKFQQSKAPEGRSPFSEDNEENRNVEEILGDTYSAPIPSTANSRSKSSLLAEEGEKDYSSSSNSSGDEEPDKSSVFYKGEEESINAEEDIIKPKKTISLNFKRNKEIHNEEDYNYSEDSDISDEEYEYSEDNLQENYEDSGYEDEEHEEDNNYVNYSDENYSIEGSDEDNNNDFENENINSNLNEEAEDPSSDFLKNFGF